MRRARVPSKVTRSTKLPGAQCSPELSLRSMDFRAPENLIFPAMLSYSNIHTRPIFFVHLIFLRASATGNQKYAEKVGSWGS